MSTVAPSSRWKGGVSPYGMSWQKLMMWWFIITDALLFMGFLVAYGVNRLAADAWPARADIFDLDFFIPAMTFVLITSSATMACAVAASRSGDQKATARYTWLTILGGAIFLGMQVIEWSHIIDAGARLDGNPWGVRGFSAFFFTITGFHGLHVLTGVIILLVVALRASKGRARPAGVELAGLYWHFVDLVWVFVFGCFYLL
ncbi:MAG: cytochrome oxidase subunit III [Planctomycetes bacterium]|nr:cytochrome oxidase subunit III [Planctomycetota bacterium]